MSEILKDILKSVQIHEEAGVTQNSSIRLGMAEKQLNNSILTSKNRPVEDRIALHEAMIGFLLRRGPERFKDIPQYLSKEVFENPAAVLDGKIETLYQEAHKAGDRTLKKALAQLAVDAGSGDAKFYRRLGAIALKDGELEKARDILLEAVSVMERQEQSAAADPLLQAVLGECHYKLKNYADAEACFSKILENPEAPDEDRCQAHFYLGSAHYEQDNFQKALDHFTEARKLDKKDVEIINALGSAQFTMGQHEEVLKSLLPLVKKDFANAGTYTNLGLVAAHREQFEEAADYFKKAYDLEPGNFTHQNNWGTVLLRDREYLQAARIFESLLKKPEAEKYKVSLEFNLGNSLRGLRKYREAAPHLEQALELADETTPFAHKPPYLHLVLADCYRQLARVDVNFQKLLEQAWEHANIAQKESATEEIWYEAEAILIKLEKDKALTANASGSEAPPPEPVKG